ncbi:hypothetical protein OE88DRAFT_973238 [Heliocybe sulcata]|uniref:TPR-like protein n=1 Tax=Heliocybe sulcata TaxID=5364 RepID=A0A5C3NFS7_9AGAM|nr:hypothetical protein OE88DRAFT_973238 [Heliocybe sulcata]
MLSATRCRLPVHRLVAPRAKRRVSVRRYKSSEAENRQVPATYDKELADDHTHAPLYHNYFGDARIALEDIRRFIKFSVIGFTAVGLITATAYEGSHQDGGEQWRWSGGDNGGTDSSLGWEGTHAVRNAWMSLNWGIGSVESVVNSIAFSVQDDGVSMVKTPLDVAQEFLSDALAIAKARRDRLHPETLSTLLARHANILERMGTRAALFECRSDYEQVWDALGGRGVEAARVALKLGDLNKRLGDSEDALAWWSRAIHLAAATPSLEPVPTVPSSLPSSPLAQRTLAQTLVSLSAFYATTDQLKPASTLESAALTLLTPVLAARVPATAHPAQTLHTLFLRHRAALLAFHRAEVSFALRTADNQWCISQLESAARASEGVVLALTGAPSVHPDAPESNIPHPPVAEGERSLLKTWADSQSMQRPAINLLRDARRSATEAWNLVGVLYEGTGKKKGDAERALECYERALGWAGVKADRAGNVAEPGEGTLEEEWRRLWGNYVRAREVVMKSREQSGCISIRL